jgi:hypothetical protein
MKTLQHLEFKGIPKEMMIKRIAYNKRKNKFKFNQQINNSNYRIKKYKM